MTLLDNHKERDSLDSKCILTGHYQAHDIEYNMHSMGHRNRRDNIQADSLLNLPSLKSGTHEDEKLLDQWVSVHR
eukprot:CAMPEP_0182440234 /NCGR_PEP_ID=MMETSP1167-20130531/86929_1 /TAXON_ID=2988 /ORGANISM="Mallomonas Sp, Strain CCMP3275" /LENGTH=74 /DNA_ID=CAMNT_0024634123 /DNA_START=576 /DNA_END=800 /DNA_ORIENTATION=-